MSFENGVPVQGFLSYTRDDNDDYVGVVDELKKSLEGRFHAATGRKLELFLDRESIGWGADWRARIRGSVQTATFFIPVVTMRYFESSACREELFAFYEYAKEMGVEALILPLVLSGADAITATDPREDVQLIERLNYKNIEQAWLAGYDASEWLRAIHSMVTDLKSALFEAEVALADREESTAERATSDTSGSADSITESGDSDADISALHRDFEAMTASTQRVQTALQAFGESASGLSSGSQKSTPQQKNAVLVRVARQMAAPAFELADSGAELEQKVVRTDARLRAVVEEMRSIDADAAREQVEQLIGSFAQMTEIAPAVEQMTQMVQVLRLAALTNVSMRKSLQPAIIGLQSVANAIDTVRSWQGL